MFQRNDDVPLVSVGLPIYNGERFLPACLDSLLAQTYRNFELFIADNASTDGTVAICESYAQRDPRIRLLRSERNRGSAWNHNRVRDLSLGKYFMWCGADDVMAPRLLEASVEALEQRPDAVLAYPLTVVIDEENNELSRTSSRMPLDSDDVMVRFRALFHPLEFTQNVHYGVFRRDRLVRARPLGSFMANDRILIAELALMGPFLRVDEFLLYRRRHVGHRTRSQVDEQRLYVPGDSGFRAREWVVLRENARSVARASLGAGAKRRLVGALLRWAVKQRNTLIEEARGLASHTVKRLGSRVRPAALITG